MHCNLRGTESTIGQISPILTPPQRGGFSSKLCILLMPYFCVQQREKN